MSFNKSREQTDKHTSTKTIRVQSDEFTILNKTNVETKTLKNTNESQTENNHNLIEETTEIKIECEIEEAQPIQETKQKNIKALIQEIQKQYSDPEVIHLKIVRKQHIIPLTDSNQYGKISTKFQQAQIIKKEYYTILNKRKKNEKKKMKKMNLIYHT